MVRTDVFVVGGGPAGLAAAIAARLKGLAVTVVDGSRPPIDKACGEGLMPDGVAALERLGVRVGPPEFIPFRGIRFLDDNAAATALFASVAGMGVRRTVLHSLLVERATEVGVSIEWGRCVKELDRGRARWIIGADGIDSKVRQWAGFRSRNASERRFGFRRHFRIAPWSDTVDVYWSRDCQIYVSPVGPAEVCVAVIASRPIRLAEALARHSELRRRLNDAEASSKERGSFTQCHRLRSVVRGNVALVGDASGSVDAITGEGLALSFRQALVLADCLTLGRAADYAAEHRRIARMPGLMASLMLLMDRQAWLRQRVIRAFAAEPGIFSDLLSVHIGATSLVRFGPGSAFKLGWQLLTAGGVA